MKFSSSQLSSILLQIVFSAYKSSLKSVSQFVGYSVVRSLKQSKIALKTFIRNLWQKIIFKRIQNVIAFQSNYCLKCFHRYSHFNNRLNGSCHSNAYRDNNNWHRVLEDQREEGIICSAVFNGPVFDTKVQAENVSSYSSQIVVLQMSHDEQRHGKYNGHNPDQ